MRTLATLLGLAAPALAQGGLFDLGTFGGSGGQALDVSSDGSVVVGFAQLPSGNSGAFRWTAATGMQLVPVGGNRSAEASLVSADGRFVAGTVTLFGVVDAFRWSAATGLERLGSSSASAGGANRTTQPFAISADGGVVVGDSLDLQGQPLAFVWTPSSGLVDLGTFGGPQSQARAVSADGTTVVGWAYDAQLRQRPFRWTAATGLVDLGSLGGMHGYAQAVSADGSVVVGSAHGPTGAYRPFRWTASTGMQDLGTLGGQGGFATQVSSDGTVVGGAAAFGPSSATRTFRWTAATGMVDILASAWIAGGMSAMSDDGSTFVGTFATPTVLMGRAFRWDAASGVTQLGTFGGNYSAPTAVSADGAIVVGIATTVEPGAASRPFRWELGATAPIGMASCSGSPPNSTGVQGRIQLFGNNAIAENDVEMRASSLPLQQFGFFLVGSTQGLVPGAGGSQGTLCLGGSIGRFVGPGQVQSSGSSGAFALACDLGALPQPAGSATVAYGETWYFQAWHRDSVAGQATSNFTDAVSVTFR